MMVLLALPAESPAQWVANARAATRSADYAAFAATHGERERLAADRTMAAVVGIVTGAILGGVVGLGAGWATCSASDEFCIPAVTVLAAGAGAVLGSAAWASAVPGPGNCSRAQRFGLALLGTVVGSGLGALVMQATNDTAGTIFAAILVPSGAGWFQYWC